MEIKSSSSLNLIQPPAVPVKGTQGSGSSEAPKVKAPEPESRASRKPEPVSISDNKAVFVLQDNKHVVIQFLDKHGEVVKQIPPKEVVRAYERLQQMMNSSINNEA